MPTLSPDCPETWPRYLKRSDVLNCILSLFDKPRYLEIGVNNGDTFFNVDADAKVGVDPTFLFNVDEAILAHSNATFHAVESDVYFGSIICPDERFDVIYLDGLHTVEQTLRDFCNAITFLSDDGVIVIDDVVPNSYHASLPDLAISVQLRRRLTPGSRDASWMGDVYRLVFFIATFFQQYRYATVIENHGQLVVWKGQRGSKDLVRHGLEEIGRLPFEKILTEINVYNRRSFSEIMALLRGRGAWSSVPMGQARRASELCARSSEWTEQLGLTSGNKLVADATEYSLIPFSCLNRDEFKQKALDSLSVYEGLNFKIHVPEIRLFAFEHIVVLPYGVILTKDGAVAETMQKLNSYYHERVLQSWRQLTSLKEDELTTSDDNIPILVIEQPTILNYGHWVIEVLPKIYPLLEYIVNKNIKIALPETTQIVDATLNFAGVPQSQIFRLPNNPTALTKVLYLSPISRHIGHPGYISPWCVDVLNRLTARIPPASQEKLFISRKDATGRQLLNEDQVYSLLEPLGYSYVRAGELSFEKQVELFKGASHIVGVFGAGLTNIVFCQAGTKVLMICPNHFLDHFYWNLASLRKLNYWHLNGAVKEPGDRSKSHHLFDFEVDMNKLQDVINKFESA